MAAIPSFFYAMTSLNRVSTLSILNKCRLLHHTPRSVTLSLMGSWVDRDGFARCCGSRRWRSCKFVYAHPTPTSRLLCPLGIQLLLVFGDQFLSVGRSVSDNIVRLMLGNFTVNAGLRVHSG